MNNVLLEYIDVKCKHIEDYSTWVNLGDRFKFHWQNRLVTVFESNECINRVSVSFSGSCQNLVAVSHLTNVGHMESLQDYEESGLIAVCLHSLNSCHVEPPSGWPTDMLELATKMPSWLTSYKHFLEPTAPQMVGLWWLVPAHTGKFLRPVEAP